MPRPLTIVDGVWRIRVGEGWQANAVRVDFPESAMAGYPELRVAQYDAANGESICLPADELREALANAPIREEAGRRGPFNILIGLRAIEHSGQRFPIPGMTLFLVAEPLPEQEGAQKGWGAEESEWHRSTVEAIAQDPIPILGNAADPVVATWRNSVRSSLGERLWVRLQSAMRPDVVLRHQSGAWTVVEVEPDATAFEGLAQIVGDYVDRLQLELHLRGINSPVRGVLVVQAEAAQTDQVRHLVFPGHPIRVLNSPYPH